MNEKRKITDEEKRNLAKLFKGLIPNGTLDEDDILWIMNEVENGNGDISFEDFMKAKQERRDKFAAKKSEDPHFCFKCKHQDCIPDEDPCKNCSEWPHPGYSTMASKWEPKEEEKVADTRFCKDCKFAENPIFKEPCHSCFIYFKAGDDLYHTNWQPKVEEDNVVHKDPSINFGPNMMREEEFKIQDNIRAMAEHTDSVVVGITKTVRDISDSVEKLDKDIPSIADYIDIKIDKLMEAVESLDAKLDILDQRMHDLRQHQILKDVKCVTQVKEAKKDISSTKEPPKFKVGDIVKVTNDSKNNDFFVCRLKWSEQLKEWNYLISMDLENISGAFWRVEHWLTKSEDHSEPLFKVGDKVKLKAGKTTYTVLSVTHFMCGNRKVYRYRISHSATTPHYENENRLTKA